MNRKAQEKPIRQYSRLYQKALEKQGVSGAEVKTGQYEKRLREIFASPQFQKHNVYPTMNVPLIYAVIGMCLELRDSGLSDNEIMAFTDVVFAGRRRFFDGLIRIINLLPDSFQIARKWNIGDHAKRVQDHSITYSNMALQFLSVLAVVNRIPGIRKQAVRFYSGNATASRYRPQSRSIKSSSDPLRSSLCVQRTQEKLSSQSKGIQAN